MKKLISKIKGINCRIRQGEKTKEGLNIFCYGNNECDACCGLDVCRCNNKLIKLEDHII